MASTALPSPLSSLLQAGVLLSLTATAAVAQTEFPHAAGTDSMGRAQAVSDAAGRVLIESPEFPRGLWVDLVDEAGRALAGIQVAYEGWPDSLVAVHCVDPSGLRQETLLWTRPLGDTLRLTLPAADPADLPPGLASVDWRIDSGAEELLALEEGPEFIGREAATAYLQERWQGRTGRVAVRIDSSIALAVDLDHPSPAARLVEYLENRASSSLGEKIASLVQVLLTTRTFGRDLALFEGSIVLTTSLVLVPGSELEEWVLTETGRSKGPVTLSEASAVTWLDLRYEEIVDVSPLAALTSLEWLELSGNQIVDVSPLAALTRLERLNLYSNEVVDVSPLAALTSLEWLELAYNEVADVSPLAALTSLQWLSLGGEIVDVSPLATLIGLQWLRLGGNKIIDVSPLAGLTRLEGLSLFGNEIVDVSPLTALTGLRWMRLETNEIVDVSALAALTSLEEVWLGGNKIIDVSPLAALGRLERLDLGHNEIVDASPLASLASLEVLYLHYNEIVDVSPLAALTSLRWVSLYGNEIVDVGPLATLTSLEELWLGGNKIIDVSPLAALSNLERLDLASNQIQDISPLLANPGLGEGDQVNLRGNPLSDRAVNEQIPALEARGVEVTVTY